MRPYRLIIPLSDSSEKSELDREESRREYLFGAGGLVLGAVLVVAVSHFWSGK